MAFLSLSRPITFIIFLIPYVISAHAPTPMMALGTISIAFFVATSTVLVGWIEAPSRWSTLLLWLETALVTILNATSIDHAAGGTTSVLYAPLVITVFLTQERKWWVPMIGAMTGSWLLSSWSAWAARPSGLMEMFMYGALLAFFAGAGLLLRTLMDEKARSVALLKQVEQSQAALERTYRQLQASAAHQQELAVIEERQRLAREIHDSVAHSLTALVVQIQAGRRLLDRAPDQAAEAIARSEELARQSLIETRRAVRALHTAGFEQQSDIDALQRLGRDFGLATGMTITVEADDLARGLPPDPARLEQLYRIFQESLTNAHRHGGAQTVQAFLAIRDGHLHVTIRNDGRSPTSMNPGIGLRSMVERIALLGGSLRFEPHADGLVIHLTIPIREAVL